MMVTLLVEVAVEVGGQVRVVFKVGSGNNPNQTLSITTEITAKYTVFYFYFENGFQDSNYLNF
jgi:hypothetical protein